jgi:hypothetical protein
MLCELLSLVGNTEVSLYTKKFPKIKIKCKGTGGKIIFMKDGLQLFASYICTNSMMVIYEDKLSMEVSKDFRQLVNITLAAGKFIMDHPQYDLIKEAMRLQLLEDESLQDFEIHTSQFEKGELITLDFEEVFFFYSLLELVCRIFLCEIGDDLKRMAVQSGEVTESEFYRLRGIYLKQAEDFLHNIHDLYSENESFNSLHHKLEQLNALA